MPHLPGLPLAISGLMLLITAWLCSAPPPPQSAGIATRLPTLTPTPSQSPTDTVIPTATSPPSPTPTIAPTLAPTVTPTLPLPIPTLNVTPTLVVPPPTALSPAQNTPVVLNLDPPPPVIDCSRPQITAPRGAKNSGGANRFHVSNPLPLAWEPAQCILTVETYQDGNLLEKQKNIASGTLLNLEVSKTGAVEIKIWLEGASTPADQTWVWVTLPSQPPSIACSKAQITAPAGADRQSEANHYPVSNEVTVSWKPADCPMTVEFYQAGSLGGKVFNSSSGSPLILGNPGSGETEIKIWYEGLGEPADSVWVTVE